MLLTSYCANYRHRDFLPAGRQSHRHHVLAQNRRGNISMVPEVFEVQDGTVHIYTYTNKRQVQQLSADTAMVHDMALHMNVLLCNTANMYPVTGTLASRILLRSPLYFTPENNELTSPLYQKCLSCMTIANSDKYVTVYHL